MSSEEGIVGRNNALLSQAKGKGHCAVWFRDYIRRNNDCALRLMKRCLAMHRQQGKKTLQVGQIAMAYTLQTCYIPGSLRINADMRDYFEVAFTVQQSRRYPEIWMVFQRVWDGRAAN